MQLERAKTSEVDALDLAAIWPCCAQLAGLSLPPMETVQASRTRASRRGGQRWNMVKRSTPKPAQEHLKLPAGRLAEAPSDLRRIAAEAVAEAYCLCVAAGDDAAKGRLSAIHANLIENLKVRLCAAAGEQN